MKIYTKLGDKGETSVKGKRLPKSDVLICAIGDIDELNSIIGLVLVHVKENLTYIQRKLFEIGANLSGMEELDLDVEFIEKWIDSIDLPPLKNFILPGGSYESSLLHLARTVCRRAERSLVGACANEKIIKFINRVSDLLFVLSRKYNDNGKNDIIWSKS